MCNVVGLENEYQEHSWG